MNCRVIFLFLVFLTSNDIQSFKTIVTVSTGASSSGSCKFSDFIAQTQKMDVIVRSQGDIDMELRVPRCGGMFAYTHALLPTALKRSKLKCFLFLKLDVPLFEQELKDYHEAGIFLEGRLFVSSRSPLIMSYHKKLDRLMLEKYPHSYGKNKSCARMCAVDQYLRIGIRVADLYDAKNLKLVLKENLDHANFLLQNIFNEKPFKFKEVYDEAIHYAKLLKPFVMDNMEIYLNQLILEGKGVIFEGVHGTMFDIMYGTYPYVSSDSTLASGVCARAGVGPTKIEHTLGVVQAYATRRGEGPFPTEIFDKKNMEALIESHKLYCGDNKEERFGWLDIVVLRQAILLNGIDSLAISKLDELDKLDEVSICVGYKIDGKNVEYLPLISPANPVIEPIYTKIPGWKKSTSQIKKYSDLPDNAKQFLKKIEVLTGVPISLVSVGPQVDQTLVVNQSLLPS